MKKFLSVLLTISALFLLTSACTANADDKTIKIGASITPHAEILGVVKDVLAADGYTLDIVEYNDYVLPNTATNEGELDANYFQHGPYLENFNTEKGTDLVAVVPVHYEPFGIYAGKTDSLTGLQDGSIVAVPNDTTNEARALLLLEQEGLIKLKEGAGLEATVLDVEDNPLNLDIREIEAAQLVRSLQDVDIAVINGNYAIGGNLRVNDAIAVESSESTAAQTFANVLVVKKGNEDSQKIKALQQALCSDEVRQYILENYDGAVVPIF